MKNEIRVTVYYYKSFILLEWKGIINCKIIQIFFQFLLEEKFNGIQIYIWWYTISYTKINLMWFSFKNRYRILVFFLQFRDRYLIDQILEFCVKIFAKYENFWMMWKIKYLKNINCGTNFVLIDFIFFYLILGSELVTHPSSACAEGCLTFATDQILKFAQWYRLFSLKND